MSFFVLDEADRMLDMGFSEDIKMIASKLPATCQTIMFSATMPEKLKNSQKSAEKPRRGKDCSEQACRENQTERICLLRNTEDRYRKRPVPQRRPQPRNNILGQEAKVKAINRTLQQMKINSGEMHSDLEQAERDEILYKFKTGQIDVLVATDIVARGIDIDDIAMVINFDVPHDPEDYVHRIGRTARAQRDGIAITFVSEDEISSFKQIEKFLGRVVDKNELPEGLGETPDYNAPRSRGRGGKGRDEKRPRNNSKANGSQGDSNKRRDNRKKNSAKEQNNNETSATETPQTTNAQDTVAETTTQDGTQPTTQKKRRRKPNRKPANAEGGNNLQTENGAKESNANNNKGDNAKRRNERAARDGEQAKQNNEQPNRNGGQTKRNNQQRRQRKDNASRCSTQNRKQDRKENGKSTTTKSTPNVPAIKQPTTLTTILKKPLNWLKSLGKKKN